MLSGPWQMTIPALDIWCFFVGQGQYMCTLTSTGGRWRRLRWVRDDPASWEKKVLAPLPTEV